MQLIFTAQFMPMGIAAAVPLDFEAPAGVFTFDYLPGLDPFAVYLNRGTDREWMFGRELLLLGVDKAGGEGDVRIHRIADHVWIQLIGAEDGTACVLRTARQPLLEFVMEIYQQVPQGAEVVHWDLIINRLLESAA